VEHRDLRQVMKRILIINGPNLDLLGTREPEIYGERTFEAYTEELRGAFPQARITVMHSNVEGELVNALREGAKESDGIVINPAGYSHTSVALRDAIKVVDVPVIEVHISNIHAREEFRHNALTGAVCAGVITGFGLEGYALAIHQLLQRS
jgi:3-dehydroquinate dehydratase-2